MKNSHLALSFAILLTIALTASVFSSTQVVASTPTSATQTLMTRLSPENATRGQAITWLVWTDPALPGQAVTLTITDLTNDTVVYQANKNLNSTNANSQPLYQLTVNTAAYSQDDYQFMANITVGNMEIQSMRYQSFVVQKLSIYAYVSPFYAIPGDTLNLQIFEFSYPPVAASVNITLANQTNWSPLKTWQNIQVPVSNGSRIIPFSTAGLKAGTYRLMVNATSAAGSFSSVSSYGSFQLKDIILQFPGSSYFASYFIGNNLNASIRTYANVSQTGVTISYTNYTSFTQGKVDDEYVSLTTGKATVIRSTNTWPVSARGTSTLSYQITANATIGSRHASDTGYFSLDAFEASVSVDKSSYIYGQPNTVNVTIQTNPKQGGKSYTLTITNSTNSVVMGPTSSSLRSDGTAVNLININNWLNDSYTVKASVTSTIQGTQYVRNASDDFDIIMRTFDVLTTPTYVGTFSGYVFPSFTVSTLTGQTNANMTLTIQGPASYNGKSDEYIFTKTNFDASQYNYGLPLAQAPNGTRTISVTIDSAAGENSSIGNYLFYSHSQNQVIVSEPFLLQTILLLASSPLFYVAVKKRRAAVAPISP